MRHERVDVVNKNAIKTHCTRSLCALILALLILTPSLSLAQKTFSLADIPPINNKKTITMVAEKGFWTEHLKKVMLPQFEQQTGVKVIVKAITLGAMYDLQMQSLKQGKGDFDLLTIEAGWAKEWATNGYTTPLSDLAKEFDSKGETGLIEYLEPYYPSLLQILSYKGKYHSIPYNTYVMGNHYRADLFNHPSERSAFMRIYGYALSAPKDLQQLLDVSQFFTRENGQMLAGKVLEHSYYGLTLMSGHLPHINDEFSAILWGLGGTWFRPIYGKQGNIKHFIVEANSEKSVHVADVYHRLLKFASPADKHSAYL
jgi:multiple sugar transport system substrate-binding protein